MLSSSFLKGIKAVIDTEKGTLWSRTLNKELQIHQSNKNLFLMDICQLWQNPEDEQQVQRTDHAGFTCQPVSAKSEISSQSLQVDVVHQSPKVETESADQNSDVVGDVSKVLHANHHHSFPQPDKLNHRSVSPAPSLQCQVTHHVGSLSESEVAAVSQEPAPRGSSRHCSKNSHDAPRCVVQGEDSFRQGQERPTVSRGFQGCSLDRLVHQNLREEHQAGAPVVCAIRDQETGHGDQSRAYQGVSQGVSRIAGGSEMPSTSRLRSVGSVVRTGSLHRLRHAGDQQSPTDGRASGQPEPREQESGIPHGGSGDGSARGSSTSEGAECQERAVAGPIPIHVSTDEGMPDLDYEFMPPKIPNSFQARISRDVKKFLLELQSVEQCLSNSDHRKLPRLDLLEVMCSEQSELTKQVQGLGGKAQRFGRVQGDLSTTEGRKRLFNILVTRKPKHVWISPECGPWCQWSLFNMNRSLECWEKVMQQRTANLWQIALSIVLFRYQRQHRNHFDLEQPRGSALMKTPGMSEIREHTLWNEFDMCRVGNLKTPDSQEHLRKRMAVCSTSVDLHMALHGKLCLGEHHHRPIAGQTKVQGKPMPLSQWTELYPQKFAKQVAKIMLHDQGQLCPSFAAETDDHPTKKRRLGQKMSPQEIEDRFSSSSDINWQTAMQLADRSAPRVGTLVVQQGEIIDMIKTICPQHDIKHVVLCRGTDRYVGPNVHIPRGFAPLRRQVCIQRKTEVVHADEWEPWEHLSNRGLRKKGTSARVSMTIFAAVKTTSMSPHAAASVPADADATNPAVERRPLESRSDADEGPQSKRPCIDMRERESASEPHVDARTIPITQSHNQNPINIPNQDNHQSQGIHNPDTESSQASAESEPNEIPRQVIDLASHKHGPEFLKLNQEEQSWLLKLHRNLGHPGRAKLTEFSRQLQCPDHLIRAIGDIRCSTCQETKGPVVSRPSALHENCDFGDIVSMDAVTWTNSQGSQFHFYHFLDQSTLFNTAVIAPAHSTEHACRALHTGWFNWAGPPGMLCVDAGTEMNSEEFSNYLQRHSVKCRTCAAEAHWQNARTERHGGIIQLMLNKIDIEHPITNYDQMSTALSHVTSTKNQWSRHRGYPPEMLVFGKGVRVPGSITADPTVAAHATALSPMPDGARFRQELAIREAARKSFAMVDNDQTLRRAIVHRSRPHRGFYEKGEWVMMWKKRGESEGSWIGPMQVIIQEGQNVVWVTPSQTISYSS